MHNLEYYGIDPEEFAHKLQHKAASSTAGKYSLEREHLCCWYLLIFVVVVAGAGVIVVLNVIYYMAELVFRSTRQITHGDWLLRGRYFTILPSRSIRFFLGPLRFGGKILNSNKRKLGIFIQIFRTMECAWTLLLVFFKAVYLNTQ